MLQGLQKDKPIVARSPSAFLERCPHTTVESAWPSGEEEAASALGAGSLAASACFVEQAVHPS